MIRLFLTYVLSMVIVASSAANDWAITATPADVADFTPAAIGNGLQGTLVDPSGLKLQRVYNADVHTSGGPDGVSTIIEAINPINLTISGINQHAASQTLDMKNGRVATSFRTPDANVNCSIMALQSLPAAFMAIIDIEALNTTKITIDNKPQTPSSLSEVVNRTCSILCDGTPFNIDRTSAAFDNAKQRIVTAATLVYNSRTYANHLDISLTAHEKATVTLIAVTCSSTTYPDPYNEADRQLIYAVNHGVDHLLSSHRQRWEELWKSDIVIDGDQRLQLAVRSALYNLYSSFRPGSRQSIAPMGLTSDKYFGHVFWDADTWILPVMAVMQPDMARSMIDYRIDRLPAARRIAFDHGYDGAMFPWESDWSGFESTPTFALTGPLEHHITADVANAAWTYFCATADTAWLRTEGFPLMSQCADFWVSRSMFSPADSAYHIENVVGADEYASNVTDNAFTNGAAKRALSNTVLASQTLNVAPNPLWQRVADGLAIITLPSNPLVALEHADYDGRTIKQADAALLAYPLNIITNPEAIQATIDYYAPRLDSINGPAMSHSVMAVNYARMGNPLEAQLLIDRAYLPYLRAPFMSLAETPSNNETYFMTAAGGLLQAILFGYAGLEITPTGLRQVPSTLPPSIRSITVTTPKATYEKRSTLR